MELSIKQKIISFILKLIVIISAIIYLKIINLLKKKYNNYN